MINEEKFDIELKFHADIKIKLHERFKGDEVSLSFHNISSVFEDEDGITVVTYMYDGDMAEYDDYYVRESVEEVQNLRTQALNYYRKIMEFCSIENIISNI